jgi:hypothetical protein
MENGMQAAMVGREMKTFRRPVAGTFVLLQQAAGKALAEAGSAMRIREAGSQSSSSDRRIASATLRMGCRVVMLRF